jgi:hypothetical protein
VEETMTVRSAASPNLVLIKAYLKNLLKSLDKVKAEKAAPPIPEPKKESE